MANYPTPLDFRMAYDLDGTQVFTKATGISGTVTQRNSTEVAGLNGESPQTNFSVGSANDMTTGIAAHVAFMFPQRRDILGLFTSGIFTNGSTSGIQCAVDTSTDSTNGFDGTWTQVLAPYTPPSTVIPYYRSAILGVSAPNISALRIRYNGNTTSLNIYPRVAHLFGGMTNPVFDRLAIWHPTLNQEMTGFDFGDQTRGTTQTVQFRVRNLSSSLTANGVTVASSVLTEANPTVSSQITYSSDNSTYTSILSLGAISPSTTSGVLYLRNSLLTTADVSLWAGRVRASATSFS